MTLSFCTLLYHWFLVLWHLYLFSHYAKCAYVWKSMVFDNTPFMLCLISYLPICLSVPSVSFWHRLPASLGCFEQRGLGSIIYGNKYACPSLSYCWNSIIGKLYMLQVQIFPYYEVHHLEYNKVNIWMWYRNEIENHLTRLSAIGRHIPMPPNAVMCGNSMWSVSSCRKVNQISDIYFEKPKSWYFPHPDNS